MDPTRRRHPIVRFVFTVLFVTGLAAALARWLRGPSTEAFTEPSVWPPATPWPPLTEGAPGARQAPTLPDGPGVQSAPAAESAATGGAPRRRVQVVKKATAGRTAAKKVVRVQAKEAPSNRTQVAWKPAVDGDCPDGFPVKVKVRSGLYHEPGMVAYARTNPDRCYPTAAAAEADGFTRAKR